MYKYSKWSPLIIRCIVGLGFINHGVAKLTRGTAGFEKLLTQIHVPLAHIASWIVPLTELVGGIAILIGLFVRIISFPLILVMLVAMFTIQMHFGFSSVNTIGLNANGPIFGPPGYEINLLYIAALISLIITGAGALSVDNFFFKPRNKTTI